MIIKIVCAGFDEFKKLYTPSPSEMLVGVDGGINEIVRLGKEVDLAVGDFDSCNIEEVVMYCNKIRVYPKDKDLGDLELAILEVKDFEFEKIEIYNATGGRLDHYQACINILAKYPNLNIELIDGRNRIKVTDKNVEIKQSEYKYVSLFAIDDGAKVTLTGFKYDLNNYSLNRLDNLALSNEIIADIAKIEVNGKRLLMFETK